MAHTKSVANQAIPNRGASCEVPQTEPRKEQAASCDATKLHYKDFVNSLNRISDRDIERALRRA